MSTSYLSNRPTITKDLTISRNTRANIKTIEKRYIGQWESKGHKISLYTKYDKILAIVQDLSEKTIIISSENIVGGINGNVSQSSLFKMIKGDRDKIEVTLHQNQNNYLTLWVIPKLKAAGRVDELLINKAKGYEAQARGNASLYQEYHNQNNFETACEQYEQAINQYQRAYGVKKGSREDTKEVENDLSLLRKEFFLFKLDQKMAFYLPEPKDQKEAKEIFDPFVDEEDVFELTIKVIESIPEEQRSRAENFTHAYSSEYLKNYLLAIKGYLILSKQHFESKDQYENKYQRESKDQELFSVCLKKAESLFKEITQAPGSFNTSDFLKKIGVDWLSKTIDNIPGNGYFKSILKENQFKKIAYGFGKKAQDQASKYKNSCPTYADLKAFEDVCKTYEKAINCLQIANDCLKKNNRNTQEIETAINKFQREFFEFKLPQAIALYLPADEDQSKFRKNFSLLKGKQDFFSIILKLTNNSTEEQRSLVDNFTNAYIYEFLGKRTRISASQNYLLLFRQYLQNRNAILSVRCLEKAEALIMEETKTSDPFAISNFLEMLDREPLEQLLNMFSSYDPSFEYLEKILLKKDFIRITFEDCLYNLGKLSPKPSRPTCFICFNVEEKDIGKWLESTLVPDLDRVGIEPIFPLRDLGPGKERNAFQGKIRRSDLVIVVCTPLLKDKCDAQGNVLDEVAQEIRLAIGRYNDADKYETIYPIYLKGDRGSSCPSDFFEPIVGTEFSILDKSTESSVFNYYSNAFKLFGNMCDIPIKKSREIKEQFLSETKNIIFDDQVDRNKVDLWRKNRIHKNEILLKSISHNITSQAKVVDFPPPPQDFTGRQKELNDLHEACNNSSIVVITGLGGVGKTTLVLKYADEYKSYYKFVYFIKASSQDSIVQGLIGLADKMNIPSGEMSMRLKNLRSQLNEFEGDYLLIFDGIDNPEAFEELKRHLPNNRRCILLTSRMSEDAIQHLNCKPLPLFPWRIEEAVDYLITKTKSNEQDQAKIIAERLGRFPLALKHASHYISTRNYKISKYIEEFDEHEVKLFKEKRLDLEKEEKTILTTWKVTLDKIESFHKCFIAKPILAFFSFLDQAPIPLIVVEHWFKTFFW